MNTQCLTPSAPTLWHRVTPRYLPLYGRTKFQRHRAVFILLSPIETVYRVPLYSDWNLHSLHSLEPTVSENSDEPVGFPVELHSDDNMDGPWPRNLIFSVDYWTTIILMIFVFSSLCCHKRLVFWKWILTAFMALTPCYVLVVVVSINAVVVDGAYIVIYTVYIPSSHWIHSDCLCGVT